MSGRLLILLAAFAALSCSRPIQKVHFTGETQGTYYAVTYYDREGRNFQPQVDSLLHLFDQSFSMWVPGSLISRINEGDSTVEVGDWFAHLFKVSTDVSEKTGGAFDFTIGPLVNAWGFGFKGKITMDSLKVDSLKRFVDYRKVALTSDNRVAREHGVRFDFNAIAQGYSVDILGDSLRSAGIESYLVDIGGEVLGVGTKPDGSAWKVGIENPAPDSLSERTINTTVRLTGKALATSGSYRKYYEENGVRYSHTIDPVTGYPVKHNLLSVSVLADNCTLADAYATAFMVMGLEKAKEFLEKRPGMEAFFIYSEGEGINMTYMTAGFSELIGD